MFGSLLNHTLLGEPDLYQQYNITHRRAGKKEDIFHVTKPATKIRILCENRYNYHTQTEQVFQSQEQSPMAKSSPMESDSLDAWFPRDNGNGAEPYSNAQSQAEEIFEQQRHQRLGVVVGGSLTKGLHARLDRETEIEDLAVGRYVVVRGKHKLFFCMVTDVVLDSPNPAIRSDPLVSE